MDQKNKKCTKENTLLNTDVSSVFVVQNSRKRPFIEQFNHTSINFTQKDLGTILGFFIVRDESPTSENIVNFLASEVKKRYFAPTEKPVEDKFESTLHHVNRVLEEIANIGNVEWLGTIEGVVCALAETSIHFSVTGEAHILLLRNNALIEISEGLASEDATNYPLKTFVDISSGDICPHDKIIITSRELLELIPFEELQKNAARMGEKNFIQFIETALTNECPLASATIIDITENEDRQKVPMQGEIQPPPENFFAADAFDRITEDTATDSENTDDTINIDELTDETPREYTDPRTGHIHIQGDDEVLERPTFFENFLERYTDLSDATKEFVNKKMRALSKKTSASKRDRDFQNDLENDTTDIPQSRLLYEKIVEYTKTGSYRIYTASRNIAKRTFVYCKNTIAEIRDKSSSSNNEKDHYTYSYHQDISPKEEGKNILPRISKITSLWSSMSNKTKSGAIAFIVFIAIVPLLFSMFSRTSPQEEENTITEEETIAQEESQPTFEEPAETNSTSDPTTLYASPDTLQVTVLKDIPIGIDKKIIHTFSNSQESFPLPSDAGNITHAAAMDDLNMIFFITDTNKLYSFSPIAKKYQEQKNVPAINHENILALSTYLTYLYVLDDDMITRHTRVENGFDEGKEWLKESSNFTGSTSMTINEEIYITQNNDITRFAEGKKQRYTKDDSIKNASIAYTADEMSYVWILDTENATLFKTDKENGEALETFTHTDFSNGTSLAVQEKENIAFISTTDKTLQFSLAN